MLPLSEKFSARLPVFTNFPSATKVLSKADSSLLMDIKTISIAIQKDSFCMAMVEQVDITPQRMFEMIPKIGNQLIVFGDGTDVDNKLDKLKIFYKEIMVKAGWNNYSVINIAYKNQVVAKRKGAEDITADSLRTKLMMQAIAERAEREASDSLQTIQPDNDRNTFDSTMIQQSIQRDDNYESATVNEMREQQIIKNDKPVIDKVKPAQVKKDIKPVQKPVVKKDIQKPKAVMQKKNDY
jgi:cell division protein FtsQ